MLHRIARTIKRIALSRLDDERFLRAYANDTDRQAKLDPRKAIGGMWDEIGTLQFEFLKEQGLTPENTILDIGCGSLRAGRHLIRYLDAGHYTGIDISEEVLEAGRALVESEGLGGKVPLLVRNEGPLDFTFVDGRFDFLLAQSVFTHLRPSIIEQCLTHAKKVMHGSSVFFFTFFEGKSERAIGAISFEQSFGFYERLAARNGFLLSRHPDYDARHPRRQKMLSVRPLD